MAITLTFSVDLVLRTVVRNTVPAIPVRPTTQNNSWYKVYVRDRFLFRCFFKASLCTESALSSRLFLSGARPKTTPGTKATCVFVFLGVFFKDTASLCTGA